MFYFYLYVSKNSDIGSRVVLIKMFVLNRIKGKWYCIIVV